jgi:hypothetical protein
MEKYLSREGELKVLWGWFERHKSLFRDGETMEPAAEELIRSALHDVANTLSGIRGILDLSDPSRPLTPRDRDRLDAVLLEGVTVVQRTRHLALGTCPEAMAESPEAWRNALLAELQPLATLFKAPLDIRCDAPPSMGVPGLALREFIHGMARLLLPYAGESGIRVRCRPDSGCWRLEFEPAAAIPDCLLPNAPERRDIAARWVCYLLDALKISLTHEGSILSASMPRHAD